MKCVELREQASAAGRLASYREVSGLDIHAGVGQLIAGETRIQHGRPTCATVD